MFVWFASWFLKIVLSFNAISWIPVTIKIACTTEYAQFPAPGGKCSVGKKRSDSLWVLLPFMELITAIGGYTDLEWKG